MYSNSLLASYVVVLLSFIVIRRLTPYSLNLRGTWAKDGSELADLSSPSMVGLAIHVSLTALIHPKIMQTGGETRVEGGPSAQLIHTRSTPLFSNDNEVSSENASDVHNDVRTFPMDPRVCEEVPSKYFLFDGFR